MPGMPGMPGKPRLQVGICFLQLVTFRENCNSLEKNKYKYSHQSQVKSSHKHIEVQ